MKTNFLKKRLLSMAAPVVALLFGGTPAQVSAAPFDSPVGDWDFYFTGHQKGVAQITFENDFTLSGIFVNTPAKKARVTERDERGIVLNPEDPRGAGGLTNTYYLHYGTAAIAGNWGYDLKGKIVGVVTLASANRTNGFSFRGTVASGRRITFSATRFDTGASSVYHGVPRVVQPDISGDYFLAGKSTPMFGSKGQMRAEILNLTSTAFPNFYDVVEYGPGFVGSGFAIITSNNKLGIYTDYYTPGTTNLDIIATSGTFDASRLRGQISGFDGTNWLSLKIGQPQP